VTDQDPEEILLRAFQLDYTEEKVSLLDEAVRLADLRQDLDLGYRAREALIEASTFGGFPDKALVAFTWCLSQCDRDGERFNESELLWSYKWVASRLPYFPQIPRAKIEEVHADMAQRYQRSGLNLRPVAKIRWLAARRMGDREVALAAYDEAESLPRDSGADCAACEANDRVRYLLYAERSADALQAAAPILSGRLGCAEIPHATLGMVLRPLLDLDRGQEASRMHARGLRLVRGNREFVGTHADHLSFLALTKNDRRGLQLLEEHLPLALRTTDLDQRLRFLGAAAQLLQGLEQDAPRLKLSPQLACYQPEGRYERPVLEAWFRSEAEVLADRFDARNGNSLFRDTLRAASERMSQPRKRVPIDKN
jgi:hypothetical protein